MNYYTIGHLATITNTSRKFLIRMCNDGVMLHEKIGDLIRLTENQYILAHNSINYGKWMAENKK